MHGAPYVSVIYSIPHAGLGEPTWPDKLSPSSEVLMAQEVSVMP